MLNKKFVSLLGGSRGIGRTIVNSFLENNAIVVFTYLENENSANDLFEEVEKIQITIIILSDGCLR